MRVRLPSVLLTLIVALLSLGMASPAGGGFSSENVEWLGNLAQHTGTSGGKLVDGYFYVTDPRGVYIYDVAEPEQPELVGSLLAHQSGTNVVFAQEMPDTDGEILLVDAIAPQRWSLDGVATGMRAMHPESPSPRARLLVVDVSDKAEPEVIGSLGVTDHTWTCVLDCTYAYGRSGNIVDLTDPTHPSLSETDWRDAIGWSGYMHDFTEVAPGRLIGSGQPALYLDVTDPEHPVELARIDPGFHTLGYHGAQWPNGATDRFLLMGAEVAPKVPVDGVNLMQYAGSGCDDETAHAVATYDTSTVRAVDEKQFNARNRQGRLSGDKDGHAKQREGTGFVKLHEWRVDGRGVYADGKAPAHTLYCGHWFDAHPDWQDGGLLTIAHYDWGTRFLEVDGEGAFSEVGWFQPVGGYTGAAYWITDDIVYVHDYRRGLDILRFEHAG